MMGSIRIAAGSRNLTINTTYQAAGRRAGT